MAADWIKMRCDLQTHPKVVRISSAMCTDRLRVIGGLHAVWSLFDAHSTDGALDGYTAEAIDSLIGWTGFSAAMTSVGWLESNTQGVVLPRFDTHNGQSAKRRANDAERKRSERNPHAVHNLSAKDADEMRTREEKRREEKKEQKLSASEVGFDDFWNVYPNKTGKKPAQAKWAAKHLDGIAGQLIADVVTRMNSDRKWRDGFIPNPATYLTQERWNDEIQAVSNDGDDWRAVAV